MQVPPPEVPKATPTRIANPAVGRDIAGGNVVPATAHVTLPSGHPERPDAADVRRRSWRRRPNVRTTVFRHSRRPLEIRP